MKNWKRYSAMALAMILCLLCAACGGRGGEIDDPNEGLGGDAVRSVDTGDLAGIYMPQDLTGEWTYLELNGDGTWTLSGENGDVSGWIGYDEDYDDLYAYEDDGYSSCIFSAEDDGTLYLGAYGYFYYSGIDSAEDLWDEEWEDYWEYDFPTEDDETEPHDYPGREQEGNEYYSWNSELYQRNVSEFQGVWYYDGDLSAEMYIVIDGDGNWSYYQRTAGEEPEEMDCGVFTYSMDEASVYYADSTMYEGMSYRVFEFDTDVLVWGDEGVYYLME